MLLTINELSDKLKISVSTIRKLIKQGMPTIQATRAYRFDLDDVIAWMKQQGKK